MNNRNKKEHNLFELFVTNLDLAAKEFSHLEYSSSLDYLNKASEIQIKLKNLIENIIKARTGSLHCKDMRQITQINLLENSKNTKNNEDNENIDNESSNGNNVEKNKMSKKDKNIQNSRNNKDNKNNRNIKENHKHVKGENELKNEERKRMTWVFGIVGSILIGCLIGYDVSTSKVKRGLE